jgi:hypothetical protein
MTRGLCAVEIDPRAPGSSLRATRLESAGSTDVRPANQTRRYPRLCARVLQHSKRCAQRACRVARWCFAGRALRGESASGSNDLGGLSSSRPCSPGTLVLLISLPRTRPQQTFRLRNIAASIIF